MHTMNLNAELLRELSYIADDERCLREVLAYVKQVVASRERCREEGLFDQLDALVALAREAARR